MEIRRLSRGRFMSTVGWAVFMSIAIVILAALVGRATVNLDAALTDKPDIAIYLLLPDEHIGHTVLLREKENERDYMAETKDGFKLIKLKKGEQEWFVSEVIPLRE